MNDGRLVLWTSTIPANINPAWFCMKNTTGGLYATYSEQKVNIKAFIWMLSSLLQTSLKKTNKNRTDKTQS